MRLPHPHLAKPVYELLPALYVLLGLSALALSYFRLRGWLAAFSGFAGLACTLFGLVIMLRRRDFRAMRHEYPGKELEQLAGPDDA